MAVQIDVSDPANRLRLVNTNPVILMPSSHDLICCLIDNEACSTWFDGKLKHPHGTPRMRAIHDIQQLHTTCPRHAHTLGHQVGNAASTRDAFIGAPEAVLALRRANELITIGL